MTQQQINENAGKATGQQANEELQQVNETVTPKRKPKNLQQGIMFGASNILGGAVGGLGVAILAPVAGARAGAEKVG